MGKMSDVFWICKCRNPVAEFGSIAPPQCTWCDQPSVPYVPQSLLQESEKKLQELLEAAKSAMFWMEDLRASSAQECYLKLEKAIQSVEASIEEEEYD